MRKQLYAVAAAILAAGMLAGCSGGAKETEEQTSVQAEKETETAKIPAAAEVETEAASEKEETELLVAAAASLKNAYEEELIPMFEAQYPGVIVTGVYDSSGKLQTQIEEGLEADVFMSAATKQMDALNEKGLIAEDTYDLIVLYNGDYDYYMHRRTPEGKRALQALDENINTWCGIYDRIRDCWT